MLLWCGRTIKWSAEVLSLRWFSNFNKLMYVVCVCVWACLEISYSNICRRWHGSHSQEWWGRGLIKTVKYNTFAWYLWNQVFLRSPLPCMMPWPSGGDTPKRDHYRQPASQPASQVSRSILTTSASNAKKIAGKEWTKRNGDKLEILISSEIIPGRSQSYLLLN